MMQSLVSTAWLAERLGAADLVVLDSSWHMPATKRDAAAEFRERHIPGARFLDIDAVADLNAAAPHMLPGAAEFGAAMEAVGVGRDDRIVIYDDSPSHTAVRGWFMLRHFGAEQVAILDGGLGKWIAEGRPTESGEPKARLASFAASERADVVGKDAILAGLHEPIVDARGFARFSGNEADPRAGVAPGHIPGSRNLPFASLYAEDGTFKSEAELERLFADAGVDPARPFIATCGSGVTANSLIFAAHLLGNASAQLYDGSWSEYGADPATPKALGPA
jgi:thiosulfate/3-mercaptopyruvate sulfurtransferase